MTTIPLDPAAAPYYRHHVFFCLNERPSGQACCAQHGAQAMFDYCKQAIKAAGLSGKGGVRVNKAGCLDRCAGAPVLVIYPEGTWYTFLDQQDVDDIIASHLQRGRVVQRLLLPDGVGR